LPQTSLEARVPKQFSRHDISPVCSTHKCHFSHQYQHYYYFHLHEHSTTKTTLWDSGLYKAKMAMKRPAMPPAEAMIGALLGAAALELEAAAEPAAVLVPAPEFEEPVPDDLEAPVAELAPDAAEPVPVADAGLEATVPVVPEAAPTV
jgi:hypothetical protein